MSGDVEAGGNSIRVRCPHCGAKFRAARSLLGKTGPCAKCRTDFTVTEELAVSRPTAAPTIPEAATATPPSPAPVVAAGLTPVLEPEFPQAKGQAVGPCRAPDRVEARSDGDRAPTEILLCRSENRKALLTLLYERRWRAFMEAIGRAASDEGSNADRERAIALWRQSDDEEWSADYPAYAARRFREAMQSRDTRLTPAALRLLPELGREAEECGEVKGNLKTALVLGIAGPIGGYAGFRLFDWLTELLFRGGLWTFLPGLAFWLLGVVSILVMFLALPAAVVLALVSLGDLPKTKAYQAAVAAHDLRLVPDKYLFKASGGCDMVTLGKEKDPWFSPEKGSCSACTREAAIAAENKQPYMAGLTRIRCLNCETTFCDRHWDWGAVDASGSRAKQPLPCCPNCHAPVDLTGQKLGRRGRFADSVALLPLAETGSWKFSNLGHVLNIFRHGDSWMSRAQVEPRILEHLAALRVAGQIVQRTFGLGRGQTVQSGTVGEWRHVCRDLGVPVGEAWFPYVAPIFLSPASEDWVRGISEHYGLREFLASMEVTDLAPEDWMMSHS